MCNQKFEREATEATKIQVTCQNSSKNDDALRSKTKIPVIIKVSETCSVLQIETRVEFPGVLWISDQNYILQDTCQDEKRERNSEAGHAI